MAPNLTQIYQLLHATIRAKASGEPEVTYSSNGTEDTAEWNDARYRISLSKLTEEEIKDFKPYKTRMRLEKKKSDWSETEKKALAGVTWEGKKAYRFSY